MSELTRSKGNKNDISYWAVVGPRGGVHAWHFNSDLHISGVEYHSKTPDEYQTERNMPGHDCWLLGHKNPNTTRSIYVKTDPNTLKPAADVIDMRLRRK